MQILFCTIAFIGLLYFIFAKRRFDLFAIGFLSACIYFLPGFFGFTSYLTMGGWQEMQLHGDAYAIMLFIIVAVLSGAIVNDSLGWSAQKFEAAPIDLLHLWTLVVLATLALLVMLLTTGKALFDSDKLVMLESLNRSHLVFETATMIGATLAFLLKRWPIFSIFCAYVAFDMFISFRITLAITVISILLIWFSTRSPGRLLLSYWKQCLCGVLPGVFLFFYKQITYAVKIGDFDLLKSIVTNSATYTAMFMNSEPFGTQSILNEVTTQHYSLSGEHLKGLFYQFTLFAPQLGLKAKSFNDYFQPDLFPEIDYGLANNIWAEMWCVGRWPLLAIFVLFFVAIIFTINLNVGRRGALFRSTLAVMGSYWTFYIHRNDLGYQLNLEKRVAIVAVLTLCLAAGFRYCFPRMFSSHPLPRE